MSVNSGKHFFKLKWFCNVVNSTSIKSGYFVFDFPQGTDKYNRDGARFFIGLDSVPMHIAAAMNTPCVVLFGPSNEKMWGPWQVKHTLLTKDYSCRPCGLDGCGNGKLSDCLMAINAEEVVTAVETLLS